VFGYIDRYLGPELSVQRVDEFHDVLGVAAYLFAVLDPPYLSAKASLP
jgi:hypothetical protein